MHDPVPAFGATLRALRLERSLTQDQVAAAADMDPSEVRRLEAGRRDPGLRVLARLAAALDVTVADLVRDVGPERPSTSTSRQR